MITEMVPQNGDDHQGRRPGGARVDAGPTLQHVAGPTAASLDAQARAHARPDRAAREKAYLKSTLVHYGVPVPAMHRLAATVGQQLERDDLLQLATSLWDEPRGAPVHERRFLAADLLATRNDLLTPTDIPLVERLIRESRTWALVDTLAPAVVGPLSERHPDDLTPVLDRWAAADDIPPRRLARPPRPASHRWRRLGPLHPLCRRPPGRPRVLRPEGHRLGSAGHRAPPSRHGARLGRATGVEDVRSHPPRGGQAVRRARPGTRPRAWTTPTVTWVRGSGRRTRWRTEAPVT